MSIGKFAVKSGKPVLPRAGLKVKFPPPTHPLQNTMVSMTKQMEPRSGDRYQGAMNSPHFKQIGIIGTGRVARALVLGLADQSLAPVMVWGRTPAKCREVVGQVSNVRIALSLSEIVESCDLVAIAVSDNAIPEIVQDIS